jgi:hypothetical protein
VNVIVNVDVVAHVIVDVLVNVNALVDVDVIDLAHAARRSRRRGELPVWMLHPGARSARLARAGTSVPDQTGTWVPCSRSSPLLSGTDVPAYAPSAPKIDHVHVHVGVHVHEHVDDHVCDHVHVHVQMTTAAAVDRPRRAA